MSKFEFEDIFDYKYNFRCFVVNKKYSLEQAKAIFEREISSPFKKIITIENVYMRTNEDREKRRIWRFEDKKYKNSVAVWLIVYR